MVTEETIVKIAELLATNKVGSDSINAVLNILCESLAFEGGLIYEMDHDSNLFLKEHTDNGSLPMQEKISLDTIEEKYYRRLSDDKITYITEDSRGAHGELLSTYEASSLLIVSLVDENIKRIGFIVFYNKQESAKLTKKQLSLATSALYMLSHYIEIRIHQRKIAFTQHSFESILDNTGIDIYVNDFHNHDILYVNESMAAPYGGVEKFKNKKCHDVLFPEQNGPCSFCPQQHLIDDEGNPTKIYTWDYKRAMDDSWFRVFSSAFRWTDGRLAHVVSSANITDNKRNEELIIYMANYDSLTKLPNRRKLVSDFEAIINAEDTIEKYILFFDIDGFKNVNDTYGHDAGDEFLTQLGEFFTSVADLKDNVYRHGGDEFVALIDGSMSEDNIKSLIQTIHTRFSAPWSLKKGDVRCNTSVGVAFYPHDGNTVEGLLYKADQAMYKIKKSGGGDVCFSR